LAGILGAYGEIKQLKDNLHSRLAYCSTLHYLENTETRKSHFSLKGCITALPYFNQLPLDFFNLVDSQLILTLRYDS